MIIKKPESKPHKLVVGGNVEAHNGTLEFLGISDSQAGYVVYF
jgi:hypothetical protein